MLIANRGPPVLRSIKSSTMPDCRAPAGTGQPTDGLEAVGLSRLTSSSCRAIRAEDRVSPRFGSIESRGSSGGSRAISGSRLRPELRARRPSRWSGANSRNRSPSPGSTPPCRTGHGVSRPLAYSCITRERRGRDHTPPRGARALRSGLQALVESMISPLLLGLVAALARFLGMRIQVICRSK